MKRSCPKCGKEVDNTTSIDNFCIDCYFETNEIITIPKFELYYCTTCATYRYSNKNFTETEGIEKELSKHIRVNLDTHSIASVKLDLDFEMKKYFVVVTIRTLIGNSFKSLEKKFPIKVTKDQCKTCSRISGSFFTTILQVRFSDKDFLKYLMPKVLKDIDSFIEAVDSNSKKYEHNLHITKEIDQKTGIDLYLDNVEVTKRLIRYIQARHKTAMREKHSTKLVGVDQNGQRVFRHTFCIHFEKDKTDK
ncbi:MAG: NMD3-related protein [archaeon]